MSDEKPIEPQAYEEACRTIDGLRMELRIAHRRLDLLADSPARVAKLENIICEIACTCVGTDASESGFGLEPQRHEHQCGYRAALQEAQGVCG